MRAVMSKSFDFTTYDPTDYRHRGRLIRTLLEIERQSIDSIVNQLFMYQQMYILSVESHEAKKEILKRAYDLISVIRKNNSPWLDWDEDDKPKLAEKTTYISLFDQWKEVWGDPDDPKVKERIEWTARTLMAEHAKNKRGMLR